MAASRRDLPRPDPLRRLSPGLRGLSPTRPPSAPPPAPRHRRRFAALGFGPPPRPGGARADHPRPPRRAREASRAGGRPRRLGQPDRPEGPRPARPLARRGPRARQPHGAPPELHGDRDRRLHRRRRSGAPRAGRLPRDEGAESPLLPLPHAARGGDRGEAGRHARLSPEVRADEPAGDARRSGLVVRKAVGRGAQEGGRRGRGADRRGVPRGAARRDPRQRRDRRRALGPPGAADPPPARDRGERRAVGPPLHLAGGDPPPPSRPPTRC